MTYDVHSGTTPWSRHTILTPVTHDYPDTRHSNNMDFDNSDSSSDPDTFFEVAESDPMLEDNVRGVMPYRYELYLDDLDPHGSTESSDGEAEGAVGGAAVADGRMPMDVGRLQHVEW